MWSPKFREYFFGESCGIMFSMKAYGFNNRNFGGFFPRKEFSKPFLEEVARDAHNPGFK
jgi:hypothetical protein